MSPESDPELHNSQMEPQAQGSNIRGKFIVLEGTDSSGKNTQAKLLFKHLQHRSKDHIEVELLSFPQYGTYFGDLVAKYLRGEYGTLEGVDVEIPCLLYALDRYQIKAKLESELSSGKWFVADRYAQSNLAHQGAKFTGEEREKLIAWLETVESRLPQPDLVIYLHVPVAFTRELLNNREQKSYIGNDENADIHEKDPEYQKRVEEVYLGLASKRNNWVVIDCVDSKNNRLHSIEQIHRKIVEIVEEKL